MSDQKLYRIRVDGKQRRHQWRSLDEFQSDTDPIGTAEEFPPEAGHRHPLDRRGFIRTLAAGAGLAGGCRRDPPTRILPYTQRPSDVTPGVSNFYATAMEHDGYFTGLVVESREGRPIKIDVNREHPAGLTGTDIFHEAAIWQLYDGSRGRRPTQNDQPFSWARLFALLNADRDDHGAGLRILLPPTSSPLLHNLLDRIRQRFPAVAITFFSPIFHQNDITGAQIAFGRYLQPHHDFQVGAVLSLDADFLATTPNGIRHARQWAERRRIESPDDEMNRVYVVENMMSVTGSMADHRLRRHSFDIPALAMAIARQLPGVPASVTQRMSATSDADAQWAQAVARDLSRRPAGTTLVVVGARQPPPVHALGYAMNAALGNLGRNLHFTEPVVQMTGSNIQSVPELIRDTRDGRVDTLIMLDCNPVYNAPADLDFSEALRHIENTFCFDFYQHESADQSRYYAPLTHFLESWGDGRSFDGTVTTVQPLIRPLVDARATCEVLAALTGDRQPDAFRLLHEFWTHTRGMDERHWQAAIRSGFMDETAAPPVAVTVDSGAVRSAVAQLPQSENTDPENLALEFYPSPTIHDGRYANNAWLQEQPSPMVKLTWDNAVFFSPATAARIGVANEQRVEVDTGSARVHGPVFIAPGMADDSMAVWLGYGRRGRQAVAAGVGFNAYPLRTSQHPYATRATVRMHTGRHPLAQTQRHWTLNGRPIAFQRSLEEYRSDPDFTHHHKGPVASLLSEYQYTGHQWAMTIDTTICTGCAACTVACNAENNIQVVGKENVLRSREMAWLRIDTYYGGSPEDPTVVHQPMLCQHCERAPCEYVCPVNATVHSPDGLNEMVYNRCIGTRFCSNNCPYKVRRFNFFDYGERLAVNAGLVDLKYNPEVTVRERGVMEKCTYCVQRIRRTDIAARLENRPLNPGEIQTACQQACPTGAIQFDSLAHPDSLMARWRKQPRSYAVLNDQGTRPRTIYLARIDNPNPDLAHAGTHNHRAPP